MSLEEEIKEILNNESWGDKPLNVEETTKRIMKAIEDRTKNNFWNKFVEDNSKEYPTF